MPRLKKSPGNFNLYTVDIDAGFKNTLTLAVGFDEWKRLGLPCDDTESEDDFPDSTF